MGMSMGMGTQYRATAVRERGELEMVSKIGAFYLAHEDLATIGPSIMNLKGVDVLTTSRTTNL